MMTDPTLWLHAHRPSAWLEVSDEDAADFLQSQFSADLRNASDRAVYGLWLDHRGKIQGDGIVRREPEGTFFIFSEGTPAVPLREKLEHHIIADDVVVEDRTASMECLTIGGVNLRTEGLSALGLDGLGPGGARRVSPDLVALWPEVAPSWLRLIGAPDAIGEAARSLLESGATQLDASTYTTRRLAAGVPLIPSEIGSDETPFEAGLEGACSQTKGCFLGQEVAARQLRLGRRSKQLAAVSVEGAVPAIPAELFVAEAVVGTLRAVAPGEGVRPGLAMIKTREVERLRTSSMQLREGAAKVTLDV